MTPTQAMKIVTVLANAPDEGQASWSIQTQEVFAHMIEDLAYEPTMKAALTWIRSQPRRPTIAGLRSAVRAQLEAVGEMPATLDVDQAWGIVRDAVSRVGRYRNFPADYPALKAVVDRMGWEDLCNCDNTEVLRAQFERHYRAELGRVRDAQHAAPGLALPGESTPRLAVVRK